MTLTDILHDMHWSARLVCDEGYLSINAHANEQALGGNRKAMRSMEVEFTMLLLMMILISTLSFKGTVYTYHLYIYLYIHGSNGSIVDHP